mmetsp:Transcript_107420/g.321237  ORF Transcript_107420/g.321237 Transcript_107420/m.321237 type:complete len:433 (-) Transcript_107420:398-1696(-)
MGCTGRGGRKAFGTAPRSIASGGLLSTAGLGGGGGCCVRLCQGDAFAGRATGGGGAGTPLGPTLCHGGFGRMGRGGGGGGAGTCSTDSSAACSSISNVSIPCSSTKPSGGRGGKSSGGRLASSSSRTDCISGSPGGAGGNSGGGCNNRGSSTNLAGASASASTSSKARFAGRRGGNGGRGKSYSWTVSPLRGSAKWVASPTPSRQAVGWTSQPPRNSSSRMRPMQVQSCMEKVKRRSWGQPRPMCRNIALRPWGAISASREKCRRNTSLRQAHRQKKKFCRDESTVPGSGRLHCLGNSCCASKSRGVTRSRSSGRTSSNGTPNSAGIQSRRSANTSVKAMAEHSGLKHAKWKRCRKLVSPSPIQAEGLTKRWNLPTSRPVFGQSAMTASSVSSSSPSTAPRRPGPLQKTANRSGMPCTASTPACGPFANHSL